MIIRQGDVLIRSCKSIPKTVKQVPAENGRLIVARGEATGHHHSFPHRSGATLFRDDGTGGGFYLKTNKVIPLEHQEHTTISLAPGEYEVVIQRTMASGLVRRVAD